MTEAKVALFLLGLWIWGGLAIQVLLDDLRSLEERLMGLLNLVVLASLSAWFLVAFSQGAILVKQHTILDNPNVMPLSRLSQVSGLSTIPDHRLKRLVSPSH